MTHYDFLEEMGIGGSCHSLTIFPLDFFPKLRLLQLGLCQNLRRISQENVHNHLNQLRIDNCPQFGSFPNMKILLSSLTELKIIECLVSGDVTRRRFVIKC